MQCILLCITVIIINLFINKKKLIFIFKINIKIIKLEFNMLNSILCTKNKVTENIKYEIRHSYFQPSFGNKLAGHRISFLIESMYGDDLGDFISNPILIFELGKSDFEFIPEEILNCIHFVIGLNTIEKINSIQIINLQKKYNIETKKIGSKVFFPLPINCLLKTNGIPISMCYFNEIKLLLDFTNVPCIECINNLYVKIDMYIFKNKPIYKKIFEPILIDYNNSQFCTTKKIIENYELNHFIKITQNVSNVNYLIEGLVNQSNLITKINYLNIECVRFYIFFQNTDNVIYQKKSFDKISFIADEIEVLSFDYDELCYHNIISNNNLTKGIYVIEWANVINYVPTILTMKLDKLILPNETFFLNVYTELYNHLWFHDGICNIMNTILL